MKQNCLMYYVMSRYVKLKLVFTFYHDAPLYFVSKNKIKMYVEYFLAT